MHAQLILLLGLAISSGPTEPEVRVEAFDLEETRASYVVSLPDDYDESKRWPLIVDFHGAISPAHKGANLTRQRLWSKFVNQSPFVVVGLNGRTRAWGMTKGDKDDIAYTLHVLEQIRKKYSIDEKRIYLAGFSSGSDFLCKGGLQLKGPFAGSLVVCPGPPFVLGLRGGELLRAKDRPFFFLTGEEDYVRKEGAWQAFVALDSAGAKTMYREVPRVAHSFPSVDEYARAIEYLESLARPDESDNPVTIAREAVARKDFLLASTQLLAVKSDDAATLLAEIKQRGETLAKNAAEIDVAKEPGRAYEAWWHIRTQFYRIEKLAERAQNALQKMEEAIPRRDLYRHRRDWFRNRKTPVPEGDNTESAAASRRPPIVARASDEATWDVDRYFNYGEAAEFLRDLARQFPHRARLISMGKSLEGRDLLALEITDFSTGEPSTKPAVYVQGAIHGNEISSMMAVLYMVEQMVANPKRSRGTDRLMRRATVYVAPMVNPDAVHHFMTEPHSHWRPRYNARPFDEDGDGRVDEDPYEDLDGDGEIGLMYQLAKDGDFVFKDGRIARGEGKPRYKLIGREGIDNDKDGRYSEDRPGGVDLNRNFPVGFRSRKAFGGTSGTEAASEPETKAVIDFVSARPNINLFFDYHNAANCVFYWTGPQHEEDVAFFENVAARAESMLQYQPRPLRHTGAGLAIAWAYGQLGTPSFIVELEPGRGDPAEYYKAAWREDALIPVKEFKHPQLGEVLIGNDVKKIPKRNPHPRDLAWQADRNWNWMKHWLGQLPKLELRQPKIKQTEDGFCVTGEVANAGFMPTEFEMAKTLKRTVPVTISVEGASLSGTSKLGSLAVGEVKPFAVEIADLSESVTLLVHHPRGGTVRLPILRPKSASIPIRKSYGIEPGYATPDKAKLADNEFYKNGVSDSERGPAFELKHRKDELRVAVLLGEWRDQRHTVEPRALEEAFFSHKSYTSLSPTGQRVYGSLRDFYEEMSYGQMKVTGRVFDWIELPGRWAEYRDASFGSRVLSDRLIAGVLARDGQDALDDFDGIAVIWAGNSVRRTSALWPMRLSLKEMPDKAAFKMSEFHLGEMAAIGVACHEMGHTFGVNDKYGLGATANPMGPWCLMAKGTHGSDPSGRHRPFHMCAWCKLVIGWLKPAVIDASKPQKLALRPIGFGPGESFRILLKPDGSEYLLLENRRREGFHSDLPSPGLAILKVGPNDRPASPQTRVQLLPAHGLPPLSRGVIAEPERIAWPQKGRTKLTVDGVTISNIRLVDDVVYFAVGSP